jgi:hypothetical protein
MRAKGGAGARMITGSAELAGSVRRRLLSLRQLPRSFSSGDLHGEENDLRFPGEAAFAQGCNPPNAPATLADAPATLRLNSLGPPLVASHPATSSDIQRHRRGCRSLPQWAFAKRAAKWHTQE